MLPLLVALGAASAVAPPIEWRANVSAGQSVDLAGGFYACPAVDDAAAARLVTAVAAAYHKRDQVIRQAGCTQHWMAGSNPGWHIERKVGDSCGMKIIRHEGAIIDDIKVQTYYDCASEAHGYKVSRGGRQLFVITSETADDDE